MPHDPMTAASLLELAERVEREEPSRALDARIHQALNPDQQVMFDTGDLRTGTPASYGRLAELPMGGWSDWQAVAQIIGAKPYTTSLDAALPLVPEEWTAWEIRSRRRKTAFVAELSRMVTADDETYQIGRSSHTPAAALVAACLRARAQKEQKDG